MGVVVEVEALVTDTVVTDGCGGGCCKLQRRSKEGVVMVEVHAVVINMVVTSGGGGGHRW